MQIEKYSDRLKNLIQSAQNLALRNGHQQLTPLHLLKALLDDEDRLSGNLIEAAGGTATQVAREVDLELAKLPKVEGAGAGQIYLAPETARLFDQAEQLSQKAGDSFVTVEYMLLALALASASKAADILKRAGITAQNSTRRSATFVKAARRIVPPRSRATKHSRNTRAISPKKHARTSLIPSSAAMRKSAAPFRCSRGEPRTTQC
jgi:ATP-dependent Clp protease ATP-binding subunit ClpA